MKCRICLLLILSVFVGGCVIPLSPELTDGPNVSRQSLAFLDQPGTTRGDVLASLGPPAIEISNPGALVYISESISRDLFIPYPGIPHTRATIETGPDTSERALFVAYDAHGYVLTHKIHKVNWANLQSDCLKWRRGVKEPPTGQPH